MKRTFTFIFALALAVVGNAQKNNNVNGSNARKVVPTVSTEAQTRAALDQGSINQSKFASHQRGSAIFMEDFLNGFDGNNAFGAWTREDSGNGTIWMIADANSPAGAYSDPGEALVSTTASNGWIIFDCDLFQGGEITATNPAIDVNGYLYSPVINMSSSTSAILEFQQAFRYCCFDDKPIFVEVTNDGGNTWFVYDGAPDFTGGANDASANPYVTTIDISAVAAGQSSVQFRFGWQPNGTSTHSHYFWGIDDVAIYENPIADDVEISYVTTGDIATDWEFRVIPIEQAKPAADGGMIIGSIFTNIGTNPHQASFKVEVLDAAMNVLDADSVDAEILPIALQPNPTDPIDTVYVPTNWVPTVEGTYYVRTTVRFPETDVTPENNTMMKKFFVTADEYGHDDPDLIAGGKMVPLGGHAGTAADPFPQTGFGSYVSAYNAGSTAYGMSIRFTNTTDTNTPITLSLLKRMTDYNLTDAEFVAGREYEVVNSWTPNGSASFPYYLPYDNSADLEAGNAYFMGVQTIDEGTYELSVQAIVEADRDFSTGTWAETVDGDFIWFFGLGSLTDFTPAIRLILSEIPENVEEQKRLVGLDQFQINPNPASSNANIMFSLNTPRFVAYEVRDLNGKLMGWKNMGQFVGQSQFQIDVTSYPVGNYMVNLVIDGKDLFTQQMSVIK